ncbi:MAG: hypothetical protein H0W11_01360 [Gemmatimonadetes bacterium]|nr:hypothetical protein [Gemmatimonadota bacterium]
MSEPQPSDSRLFARPPSSPVSEALACELAMLGATLAPLPTPAAEPPQRAPPPEPPGSLGSR